MNIIEALSKYEKVTCDELVKRYQVDVCITFGRIDDRLCLFKNANGAERWEFDKDIFLSNSYREWKEVSK